MLKISYPKIKSTEDLKTAVQNAIRLEHATIPPYLTAWWTLTGSSAGAAAAQQILGDIWLDEMHHMLAACNLLNALGGAPVINQPDFVPSYPGALPMTIGASGGVGFEVGLQRYSKTLVTEVFMKIEEPETPITIPVGQPTALAAEIEDHYRTIGEFYAAIAAVIQEGGNALFSHPTSPQVTHGQVTPITDAPSAVAAVELIQRQGEGTPETPDASPGVFAHFYRFESLSKGMTLTTDAQGRPFFDPSQRIVVDDAADVVQMVDNPGQADLSQDPVGAQKAAAFDQAYAALLSKLHDVVNGQANQLGPAIGMMRALTGLASELLQHQISGGPQAGKFMGPRFLLT
ncbi:MAG TPA: ferritin-like protein [Caulobacteraceae bacterium]